MGMRIQIVLLVTLYGSAAFEYDNYGIVGYKGTTGHVTCPCIDPGLIRIVGDAEKALCNNSDYPIPIAPYGNITGLCYPAEYGAKYCQAWDDKLAPICADANGNALPGRNSDCGKKWCFVSPTCKTNLGGRLAPSVSRKFDISFDTCDTTAGVDRWHAENAMRDKTYRVFLIEYYPTILRNCSAIGCGALRDYMEHVRVRAGFTWEYVTTLVHQDPNISDYDRCILDVEVGAVDVCLAEYWMTSARLQRVAFTTPFGIDDFYPVTKQKDETNEFARYVAPLKPFGYDLWACVVGVIILAGILIFAFEYKCEACLGEGKSARINVSRSLYLSTLGFFAQGLAFSPKRSATKCLLVGYAIFIVLIIQGYTANLASFLIVQQTSVGLISTVQQAVDEKMTICMWQSSIPNFKVSYNMGTNDRTLIGVQTDSEGSEKLHQDVCQVYLNGERPVNRLLRSNQYGGCSKIMVKDIGMSIPLAMPIVVRIRTTLNYWMSKLNEEALFDRLHDKYNDVNQCYVSSSDSSDEMTPDDFIGIFVVLGAACFIAVIIRVGGFIKDKDERMRVKGTLSAMMTRGGRLDPSEKEDDAEKDVSEHPAHICKQLEHSLHEMKEMHKGLRERTKASISEFQKQQDEILTEVRALHSSLQKPSL